MKAGCLRDIESPLQISYLNLKNLLKSSSEIPLFHSVQGVIQVFIFSQHSTNNYKNLLVTYPSPPTRAKLGWVGGPQFNEDQLSVIWVKYAWGPKLGWHEMDVMDKVSHD